MRILLLGGYGLIGLAIGRRLLFEGHSVVGLGRSGRRGRLLLPDADWIEADLIPLTKPSLWRPHLLGVDAVVNAAGVLQGGLRDDVMRVQKDAIIALVSACEKEGVGTFVQISVPGAESQSGTQFYRSKAAADAAIRNSRLAWTIFRPGLVLSPQAYGGTSLLRMLTAFPLVQPLVLADARLQTVSVDDVADAVAMAVTGACAGKDFDLVEADTHSLESLVLRLRSWLGFDPPRLVVRLPRIFGRAVAFFADIAGWLGWRSALRTTALKALTSGVTGDGQAWTRASGKSLKPLDETLRSLPSTVQERIFARSRLVFPVLLLILAGFWLHAGIADLTDWGAAAPGPMGQPLATSPGLTVWGRSVAELLIGMALLLRPLVRPACGVSIAAAVAIMIGDTVSSYGLWGGTSVRFVEGLLAIGLASAVSALAERR